MTPFERALRVLHAQAELDVDERAREDARLSDAALRAAEASQAAGRVREAASDELTRQWRSARLNPALIDAVRAARSRVMADAASRHEAARCRAEEHEAGRTRLGEARHLERGLQQARSEAARTERVALQARQAAELDELWLHALGGGPR